MSLIFLVGMPGAGKTYWGRHASQAHGWNFIDMDEYLEETYRQTIPYIFSNQGEASFREKEQAILHKIIASAKNNTIVACGGGTPAFFNNLNDMKNAGRVVYLQADLEVLLPRLEQDMSRPLFRNGADIKQQVNKLLLERAAFFEQADYIIPVQNISVLTFEKIIQQCTEQQ